MSESKVIMKIEQEIKPLKELCEEIVTITKSELVKGIDCIDTKELGEVVDMIKDLAQAKKEIVEACYKMQIMEAMETSEYGVDYDETGKIKYYTPMKDDNSRMYFTYPETMNYYPMRDMDKQYGRMYYSESSKPINTYEDTYPFEIRDAREGRSPIRRKMYMESKALHKDKATQMEELNKYMQELSHDITEMIKEASPEEKMMLQQKISTLADKIQ